MVATGKQLTIRRHNEECSCQPILIGPLQAFLIISLTDILMSGDDDMMEARALAAASATEALGAYISSKDIATAAAALRTSVDRANDMAVDELEGNDHAYIN